MLRPRKIRQVDHHGGYTAAAGHALYTARTYPQPFWNRTAFVAEPTGHLVGSVATRREGSDFRSTNPGNLFASDDEWVAPIMAEVGPDGNVWVIDWYNYIVQHNPTPAGFTTGKGNAYETELRDKQHGRIYRVVYRGAPKSEPLNLQQRIARQARGDARPSEHAVAQARPAVAGRTRAAGRCAGAAGLAGGSHLDAIGLDAGAIHALWTLHGLGALDGSHPEATAAALRL